jgi:hypothetical protein
MPTFGDLVFLMPLALLFGRMGGIKALLGDCDTGWHIRTGEWIAAHHRVPLQDVFSYSKPGDPWFAWEWLSDVLFAWIHGHGGLQALVLFTILLICTVFLLLYRLVRSKSNVIIAVVLTTFAAAAASIHWLARPHLFTLLFLTLFYNALENVRAGRTRVLGVPYLAAFPLATVLWTNLHGGFFVGIILIFGYGVGEFLEVLLAEEVTGPAAWKKCRSYFLSGAACAAASLVNPYTWHLHAHMAKYLLDPWNGGHIAEFLSPNFHHPAAIFLEALLVLGGTAVYQGIRRRRFTEVVLFGMWAHAMLLAQRNIPIFAIVAAPMAAEAVQYWLASAGQWNVAAWMRRAVAKFNQLAADAAAFEDGTRWHVASVAGVALVAALLWAPNPPRLFRAEFNPSYYPARALPMLRQDAKARIFTNDEWGDYLIWSLYPGHQVFVDGRSDFYGDNFEASYADILNVKDGWEKTLSRFGVNTILLPPDAPLAGALKLSSRWSVAYDDGIALVFRPAAAAHRAPGVAL